MWVIVDLVIVGSVSYWAKIGVMLLVFVLLVRDEDFVHFPSIPYIIIFMLDYVFVPWSPALRALRS